MALWERQEGESKPAYNAFWTYCTIPPDEKRSYAKVGEKLGKSEPLIDRWGSRWNWQERARAYDNHLMEAELEALKRERVEAARRHAQIAKSFQNKIIKRLTSIKPEELSPKDLTSWLDVAVKIERQALGEPTEFIAQELTGKGGGPVEIRDETDLSKLTEKELTVLVELLAKSQISPEQSPQGETVADDRGSQNPPPANRRRKSEPAKGSRKK